MAFRLMLFTTSLYLTAQFVCGRLANTVTLKNAADANLQYPLAGLGTAGGN